MSETRETLYDVVDRTRREVEAHNAAVDPLEPHPVMVGAYVVAYDAPYTDHKEFMAGYAPGWIQWVKPDRPPFRPYAVVRYYRADPSFTF